MLVGIWTDIDISSNFFSIKCIPIINRIIESPNITIITSNKHIRLLKFLQQYYFRKIVLYHVGETCNNNLGKWKTKGGFASYAEIYAEIKLDCDEFYDI